MVEGVTKFKVQRDLSEKLQTDGGAVTSQHHQYVQAKGEGVGRDEGGLGLLADKQALQVGQDVGPGHLGQLGRVQLVAVGQPGQRHAGQLHGLLVLVGQPSAKAGLQGSKPENKDDTERQSEVVICLLTDHIKGTVA